MESQRQREPVSFTQLQDRLLRTVLLRLNNGEITERGLARIVGVSQPQIHNVLKGKRRLQPDLADRLLLKLEIAIFDLLQMKDEPSLFIPEPPPRKRPGRATDARSTLRLFG